MQQMHRVLHMLNVAVLDSLELQLASLVMFARTQSRCISCSF